MCQLFLQAIFTSAFLSKASRWDHISTAYPRPIFPRPPEKTPPTTSLPLTYGVSVLEWLL